MVASAEGHFWRNHDDLTLWVGFLQSRQFLRTIFCGEDENATHFDGAGGRDRLIPLGVRHFAYAATELGGDGISLSLCGAEKPDSDRFTALDHLDDQVWISREALFPSIHPL